MKKIFNVFTPLANGVYSCSCGFPKPSRLILLDSVEFEKVKQQQHPLSILPITH